MAQMTRRGFLSAAALAAMAGAATSASALYGCASQEKPDAQGAGAVDETDAGSETNAEPQAEAQAEAKEPEKPAFNAQDASYDTYTTDYAALFEPIQVGSLTLKNRLIKSAAGCDTGDRKLKEITQNTLDYYGRMAKGGASLIILPSTLISHLGFDPRSLGKIVFDDPEEGIPAAKVLTDKIHEYGCYIGYLLNGPGTLVASVQNDITIEEIKQFVADTGECCRRLKEAGFDMVEIKASATDGLNAFVSRRLNQREDEYGPQSLENRTRLFVEMIRAAKEACGEDFTVSAHINGCEENDALLGDNDKFITVEEAKEIAKILVKAGADMIQVRVGTPGKEIGCWGPDGAHAGYGIDGTTGFGTRFDYSSHFGGMLDGAHSGVGSYIPLVEAIKTAVDVPVGCAGYMDPRTAPDLINNAVAEGRVDLVIMNRPLTVDPELPNKLAEGRRDEVAPCCRCLHCHDQTMGIPECCRVNATTQHAYKESMPEGYEPLPADTEKLVMVVGGGPAGMEAARVAAQRGHKVVLYEKAPALGGLVNTAAVFKGDHERLGDLVAYLSRQLELVGVEVNLGREVDADLVKSVAPDAVVVATGGTRASRLKQSGAGPAVIGLDDIAAGEIGDRVVVLGAGAQAVDVTMYLLAQGKTVQMVHEGTRAEVDKEQSAWFQQLIPPQLQAQGVKIWNETTVEGIGNGCLQVATASGVPAEIPCDAVLECYDMEPNAGLADALGSAYEVVSVGDCAVPWNIQQAIFTANIAARAL